MSDVTNQYVVRTKHVAEEQYLSLRSTVVKTMQRQGWKVEQVSFIAGARSLNKEELKKNLPYFKVPIGSVEPIHTKLTMMIFDEYANILKGMYSIRLNGRSDHEVTTDRSSNGRSDHRDTPARPTWGPSPPLINSFTVCQSNKIRKHKEGEKKERD
jgi:hypothetical protein